MINSPEPPRIVRNTASSYEPLLTEADGFTSFQAMLTALATIERHTMEVRGYPFALVTEPDALQRRILELLDIPIPA